MIWLLLILGLITYFIVQRVTGITRTPPWLLWLVAMMPAFILIAWTLVTRGKPMPIELMIGTFVVCLFIYGFLIQWGRISSSTVATPLAPEQTAQPPVPKEVRAETEPTLLRLLDKTEETSLQNCFPWTVYYLQNVEYRPQAVICRGQLRAAAEVAYRTVRENVETQFGDRFYVVFQEGTNGKPFFALVPNAQAKATGRSRSDPISRPGFALGLLAATLATTTQAGVDLAGISAQELGADPRRFLAGLPYALVLLTILGARGLGQYLVTQYYQVRATLPYLIPVPPGFFSPFFSLGMFWALVQVRSPIPHRKALFDINVVGPLAGFLLALPVLVWGLAHSTVIDPPVVPKTWDLTTFFTILNPGDSILIALLSKLAWAIALATQLPLEGTLTSDSVIKLHPIAVAGYWGFWVTAFNLIPVGQLDGGHLIHAMFGQRSAVAIGQVTRLLVLALSLVRRELVLWALMLFLIPIADEPTLNDVTELDNRRDFLGILALGLLLLMILPTPKIMTQLLF